MIQRSRAVFEPFPPHLDIQEEVRASPRFEFAKRIPYDSINQYPREVLELFVITHVVKLGLPLVITGFDKCLDKSLFSEKWLQQHYASQSRWFPSPWILILVPLKITSDLCLLSKHTTPEIWASGRICP